MNKKKIIRKTKREDFENNFECDNAVYPGRE